MSKFLEETIIDSMDVTKPKGTIEVLFQIMVAIELCGSFLTGRTGQSTSRRNFIKFITSKYIPNEYHDKAELLYLIFRNSVAHHYIPKGAALPTSEPSIQHYHLNLFKEGLCIFVPTMASDISEAVKQLIVDIKQDNILREKYYKVLRTLDEEGKRVYENYLLKSKNNPPVGNFSGDIVVDI